MKSDSSIDVIGAILIDRTDANWTQKSVMTIFRFEKRNEYEGKPKGYSDTFYIFGADGQLRCCCDVFGWGEKAPTRFLKLKDASKAEFTLTAKRKLINSEFYLNEGEDGRRLCVITRKGKGTLWKMVDTQDRELGRFIDPASSSEVFFRALLQGSADLYALVSDENLIGRIRKEPRPKKDKGRGLVKLISKLLTPSDWVLQLEPGAQDAIDERFLIAGMILLQIQDISTSRAKPG